MLKCRAIIIVWVLIIGVNAFGADGDLIVNGNLGVGTTAPTEKLDVTGKIKVSSDLTITSGWLGVGTATPASLFNMVSNSSSVAKIETYLNGGGGGGIVDLRAARGTYSSPLISSGYDRLGGLLFKGHDGTGFQYGAKIEATIDSGTVNAGSMPTRLTFFTTPSGSTTLSERMRITSAGNVGIGTTSPGAKLHSVVGDAEAGFGTTSGANYIYLTPKHTSWNGSPPMIDMGGTGLKRLILNVNTSAIRFTDTGGGADFVFDVNGGSEWLRIKGDGKVGIGTADPTAPLDFGTALTDKIHLYSSAGDYYGLGISNVGGYYNTNLYGGVGADVTLRTGGPSGTVLAFFKSTGSVGIGTTSPSYTLHVNGTAAGTSWTNLSDQRFKKNISPITSALGKVQQLQGVTFDWKKEEFKDRNFQAGKQIGLIAQQVEKIIPEVVTTDKDGFKGVAYANLTALLIEAVKELKSENDKLRQQNEQVLKRLSLIERGK